MRLFSQNTPFPIGFNYWPRKTAIRMWENYVSSDFEKELQIIQEFGVNHLRIFLRWEDLTPELGVINSNTLENFRDFHDKATKYHLTLTPTFFIGHMSGQDWFPAWFSLTEEQIQQGIPYQEILMPPTKKTTGKVRDIYRDETVFQQAFLQLKHILPEYKNSSTILAWDISNENQYWMPPRTPSEGYQYIQRLYQRMKQLDPHHPITIGMGKLKENSGFHSKGTNGINHWIDFYTVHSYPVFYYPMGSRFIDFYVTYNPGFDITFAQITGLPIQMQEIGLSADFTNPNIIEGYYNVALWSSLAAGCEAGILTWNFCDFVPDLQNVTPYNHKPYELHFGSFDDKYNLYPWGKQFKEIVQLLSEVEWKQYASEPNKIGILICQDYFQYSSLETRWTALTDDHPAKELRNGQLTISCLENQNKTLFSWYVWCQMIHQPPDFYILENLEDRNIDKKLLICPNIRSFSKKSIEILLNYIKKGGWIFLSSHSYFPKQLVKKLNYEIPSYKVIQKRTKKRNLELNTLKMEEITTYFKVFQQKPLILYNDLQYLSINDSSHAIFRDNYSKEFFGFSYPDQDSSGGLFFLNTTPSVFHTTKRKMAKKETMFRLIRAVYQMANKEGLKTEDFRRKLGIHNPYIEIFLKKHKNEDAVLIGLINHSPSPQSITFAPTFPLHRYKIIYSPDVRKEKTHIPNPISLKGWRTLILQKRNS